LDPKGFVVYSNWGTSKKARDFGSNKWVSLAFWWEELERQVRVEGIGERMTREEGQKYFDTRGRSSRIGAWSSRQSQKIDDDKKQLEKWYVSLFLLCGPVLSYTIGVPSSLRGQLIRELFGQIYHQVYK